MHYVWVDWNDPIFKWNCGEEDFIWSKARREINDNLPGGDFFFGLPALHRGATAVKLDPVFNVKVDVKGLTHYYTAKKLAKPKIKVDQVQMNERAHGPEITVKAEIKK